VLRACSLVRSCGELTRVSGFKSTNSPRSGKKGTLHIATKTKSTGRTLSLPKISSSHGTTMALALLRAMRSSNPSSVLVWLPTQTLPSSYCKPFTRRKIKTKVWMTSRSLCKTSLRFSGATKSVSLCSASSKRKVRNATRTTCSQSPSLIYLSEDSTTPTSGKQIWVKKARV
jgi:hypothetical protein